MGTENDRWRMIHTVLDVFPNLDFSCMHLQGGQTVAGIGVHNCRNPGRLLRAPAAETRRPWAA
jgi:hypothetical protein